MRSIRIVGAGPAGSCAALAALREGAAVEIFERSKLPHHKVCGEFLSPEVAAVFERLGVMDALMAARPFRVRRMALHLGRRSKWDALAEPAFGLSRYSLDHMLFESAIRAGAVAAGEVHDSPDILATGRPGSESPRGARLFGFKAHFSGPADDAVELFFSGRSYVGVNCIEGGRTNVCGLAPENDLKRWGFEPENLIRACPPMKDRIAPLERITRWYFSGPLEFAQHWERTDVLLAGDALSFVDPFTGSGMLCAARTGSLAGLHAGRSLPIEAYTKAARAALARPFAFSSFLRRIARTDWAETLLPLVPGGLLFRLSRPR